MIIAFNSDQPCIDEVIYIKDNETEYAISVGETIDINSQIFTLYTKAHVRLTMLSKILLFIKRFFINFFNIVIMNFPNKWYQNAEPYIFEPLIIDTGKVSTNIVEIKVVHSKFNLETKIIKKPQLYVDNKLVSSEVKYNKESINILLLTYIYDMISLLLYTCALISFVFLCSGKMGLPVMVVIYSIIMSIMCIPVLYKCVYAYKEKKDFEKYV